jgi:DNA-binding SARP family transcriptional activator
MIPHLELLGGARILDPSGAPLRGRSAHRRRLAVLAILGAARRRPVGRERILRLLWPDSSASDARHSLAESLSIIRRDLRADPFVCVGDEVALDPSHLSCDLEQFTRALATGDTAEAAELYAGPFLDGFLVKDAPEFERWAEEEQSALAFAFARSLEKDATRRESEGDVRGALESWRRLAVHDRFSTRVVLCLANALHATGDTVAAVQQLDLHCGVLHRELQMAPPPELVQARDSLCVGTRKSGSCGVGSADTPFVHRNPSHVIQLDSP